MNKLKKEFNKSYGLEKGWIIDTGFGTAFDAFDYTKKLWNWINQNYISKEEINKEIDYSEAHHEVVLENWEEESRDIFKSKSEVKGFLMALEAFRELIINLLNKKDE